MWLAEYLYVLDDVSEGRGAFGPGPHQLHGLVKVSDVVGIHPQEGCMLQPNMTQAWPLPPGFDESQGCKGLE